MPVRDFVLAADRDWLQTEVTLRVTHSKFYVT